MQKLATFTHMKDGSKEDWSLIGKELSHFAQGLPSRLIKFLQQLEGQYDGFPVDRLTHSLQAATRAYRDGKDEEYVVCALLHDIGDELGSYNHPDFAAAVLKPFVSTQNLWMIEHHGIFQGYYFFHHIGMDRNLRDAFADHPQYQQTVDFCEKYDAAAFDPNYPHLPLDFFIPMVNRLFSKPKNSIYKDALK